MTTRSRLFLATACLLVASCSSSEEDARIDQPTRNAQAPTQVRLDGIVLSGDQWRYRAVRQNNIVEIDLDLPMDRVAPDRFVTLEKLAETDDGVVVILDSYASRSDSACADGRETFVRVFSLSNRRSLLERQVASCIDGTHPPEPYATVDGEELVIGEERFSISGDALASSPFR